MVSQKVTLAFGSKAWYARGHEVESDEVIK